MFNDFHSDLPYWRPDRQLAQGIFMRIAFVRTTSRALRKTLNILTLLSQFSILMALANFGRAGAMADAPKFIIKLASLTSVNFYV